MTVVTRKKWWEDSYPSQYYAFATSNVLGGYPMAGLVDLDVYSSQPDWLTASTVIVSLTKDEWTSIVPCDLIIKDGAVQTYVAPTTTTNASMSSTTTATTISAES